MELKRKGRIYLEYLTRVNPRLLFVFLIAILGVSVVLGVNAKMLYQSTEENIVNLGKVHAIESAHVFNEYLKTSIDAINLAAYNIEAMNSNGADKKSIEEYMVQQSNQYANAISENYNGVYGYINGCYLDGTGWKPDKFYDPTTREWYVKAVARKGETTLITPYVDAMTNTSIMTVSKMMNDGRSVVAVDLTLDGMREINEEAFFKEKGNSAFLVLDEKGTLINFFGDYKNDAHRFANPEEVSVKVAKKLKKVESNHFKIKIENKEYFVYAESVHNQWYAVSVMDEKEMFSDLIQVEFFMAIFTAVMVIAVLAVFIGMNRKYVETEELNLQLQSLADIYTSVYTINLKSNRIVEVSNESEAVSDLVMGKHKHADFILHMMMEFYSDKDNREEMMDFIRFDMLDERMKEAKTITKEFLNHNNCWCRARFIVVDRFETGKLKKVMWMIEKIDEEKRQRDRLLYLSEIDRMTGILNRGCGEAKIRSLLESKEGGMFILFDVDHFKSINDIYGHGVGDRVIVEIANAMKTVADREDIVMRLGGDEFAAFIPKMFERQEGRKRIDDFLMLIEKLDIPELMERIVEVSMGVVFCKPGESITFEELYKEADRCTYISKKQSGSKATFWD